jgi:hypothetical protein
MEQFANLLLLGIESRGKRATGFVAHKPGGKEIVLDKRAITATDFIKERLPIPQGANIWLGHTRLDTQGTPDKNENNHPVVCNTTFVTHNGTIRNDDELFEKHKITRNAEVDSAIIATLLDKFGQDKVEEALAQLQGGFSIAAIDPSKSPDTVVLANGGWPPLVLHESDKFVIWASTRSAIKDAWKVILGTPPADKNFKNFSSGDIAIINKDGINYKKFESKPDFQPRVRQTTTGQGRTGNSGVRAPYVHQHRRHGPPPPAEKRLPAKPELKPGRHVADVVAVRKDGKGLARLADIYHAGGYPENRFPKDAVLTWEYCEGCMTLVYEEDMQDTVNWGYICDDCYDQCIVRAGYKPDNPTDAFDDGDIVALENWAKMESNVHREALKRTAKEVDLDEDTVDFLVFRVPSSYLDKRDDVAGLAGDLDDVYQEHANEVWAAFGVDNPEDLRASRPESDSGVQDGERPGTSPGEKPDNVTYLPPPNERPKSGARVRCSTHEVWFPWNETCPTCRENLEELRTRYHLWRDKQDHPSSSDDLHENTLPDLTVTQCHTCTRKQIPKVHILDWGWCKKHYKTCNRCEAGVEANSTAPNGDRLCHHCSRGEKGLLYDSQLERQGIEVVELAHTISGSHA